MPVATKLVAPGQIEVGEANPAGPLPEGWVRLHLARAGICGTDMHYFKHFGNAGFPLQNPVSLGHEACAYVLDPNGSDLPEGALVAVNPIIGCGRCEYCQSGQENLCTDKKFPGSALTVPHIDGFFQEVFAFPAACCHPAPEGVTPAELAFTEPLACSLHAVNLAEVGPGSQVLVMGCGPMGLLAAIGALAKGATVDCADMKPELVEKAVKLGARTGYLIGGDSEPVPTLRYDCVVEATGAIPAFNLAMKAARKGGAVAVVSTLQPGANGVDLNLIMLKELSIIGAFQFNREFREAMAIIASGQFDFSLLIGRTFPLEEAREAFALATSGQAGGKVQFSI
ncbi:zinc-binding dehydrogenase [Caulobacter sp. X]|uniref:zinc-dependent alcohol dehydrogenase n=1 Tax=Caulobacter sp. X TaxID=2048901 RepID=UPI000C14BF1E|nr:alcohol dehydrogenase catalytic domain-containing protein [Caulobacter sp. X]PIB95243.1 L-idonate 5-dehydrogenase [Caulobacter sp. X]